MTARAEAHGAARIEASETLPVAMLDRLGFPSRLEALKSVHFAEAAPVQLIDSAALAPTPTSTAP